jgi:hypothetical protein
MQRTDSGDVKGCAKASRMKLLVILKLERVETDEESSLAGQTIPLSNSASANGAEYNSQGQARAKRSASPLVTN